MNFSSLRRGLRTTPALALVGATALALAGCNTDKLVQVSDPASLKPGEVGNAAAVPGLVQGALVQFVGGYSGFGGDAFLSMGVITDEMYYGDTFTTRQAADSRNLQPTALGNISDAAFLRLQQARVNARRAFAAVSRFSTAGTARADSLTRARLRAIEGYAYVALSEGWCGSVPFSIVPDTGEVDPALVTYTAPLTTRQMNDTAITRFTEALQFDRNSSLAKIGLARALMNNQRYSEAAAAVASVPTTYVFLLEHSTNSGDQNNPITALQQNGRYGVSNLEGAVTSTGAVLRPDQGSGTTAASAEGLPFRGANDPRVPYERKGGCFTSSITCFLNDNYPTLDADVPLASGVEARLIEAEAALAAGDVATFMQRLNDLRASTTSLLTKLYPNQKQVFFTNGAPTGLAPLTDPGTATGRRDLLFSERAFWLYNTGHRQGDLRRLVRQYGVPSNQAFPSGPFFRGGLTFGNDVAYPVPFNEQNNANFNPATCSTTAA